MKIPFSKNRKAALLDVRARRDTRRKRQTEQILKITWKCTCVLLVVTGSWLGTNKLLTKFFYANPTYNIRHILIHSKDTLSSEEAITAANLHVGTNIFRVHLEHTRNALLALPQVRNAIVERVLPDTIQIRVEPKIPVAWLISEKAEKSGQDPYTAKDTLLLEQKGAFYRSIRLLPSYYTLPVIYGIDQALLIAGDPLEAEDLYRALELLHLATQRKNPPVRLRSLDLSEGYCIKARGMKNEEMIFALENFDEQLDRLQELLRFCEHVGKKIESVNLFVHRNTPVRFANMAKE